jgi:predicted dehydrogenase
MKTIRWGIIGCGDVTEVKSGPGLQKAKNSQLMAVMRRDSEKAASYAKRHKVPKWYIDAEALINDNDVDAVYIATPPDSHNYYTKKVAIAGKPVYVEKPMARSFSECQEMIQICQQTRVPLFTAYYRRSLLLFLQVKELLRSKQIGDIRFVNVRLYQPPLEIDYNFNDLPWRVIPNIAGGGYFVDLASHTLDLLDFFFGPICNVFGLSENQAGLYPAEDIVSASFRFENGIIGSGVWCFTTNEQVDVVEIIGSSGKIYFSTFQENPLTLHNKKGGKSWTFKKPAHIQQPHIQSIVNELNGQGKCASDGESAARTSWVIDQILKEWRKQKNIHF